MKNLRLKSARAALDMSQQQLADAVGVSRQTINAIEKGDYNPTIKLCIAICKVLLVVTAANLLFGVSHIIDGDLLRDGVLSFRSANLIVGITTGIVLVVYWLHGLHERGEAE